MFNLHKTRTCFLTRGGALLAAKSALCLLAVSALAQSGPTSPKQPWFDTARPLTERVHSLVSQMTLAEKIGQMSDFAPAIPRLGVPTYFWWNEGLHGVARAGYATNFPQAIGMAATWDSALVHSEGDVISTEARAKYNDAIAHHVYAQYFGLTIWSPNINIFRDPRWGRGQETYGEDPFLTAQIGTNFIRGLQGDDPHILKTVATAKHFAVHSGPEKTRHEANVGVSPFDLEDTYLPAFRAAMVDAHAASLMCAYNSIDGAPACANNMLLSQVLRSSWHFTGPVVSDCGAIVDIYRGHRFSADATDADAAAVRAGTDLECGNHANPAYAKLYEAVSKHMLATSEIDTAVTRLFTARFRLRMFDPPSSYAYGRIPLSENNTPAHRNLARKAALESIVLLTNNGHALPLSPTMRRIAVIGPNAELIASLEGNYNGTLPNPVSPLAGITARFGAGNVSYAQGASLVRGYAVPIARTALHHGANNEPGLKAEYFPSLAMTGAPLLVRTDSAINFNWDKAAPFPGMPVDNFSVRWTGSFTPPAPGDYTLGVHIAVCGACKPNDEFTLSLDGHVVATSEGIDEKALRAASVADVALHFDDAKPHALELEYKHRTGSAAVDLTWIAPAAAQLREAVDAANNSDVVIACLGLSPFLEGEESGISLPGFDHGDRTTIDLPATQEKLFEALVATGKPVIVVLMNGSALSVNFMAAHAAAILEAWYPGEEGGTAIAAILTGDVNPSGKLPITFYKSLEDLPAFDNYSMEHRTYRYFAGQALFRFGDGLSYTQFAYSGLRLRAKRLQAGEPLVFDIEVKNTGTREGDEVVQAYLNQPGDHAPLRKLVAFQRITLRAGASQRVRLTVAPRSLSEVDENGHRQVEEGSYVLHVGGGQPGGAAETLDANFAVEGTRSLPK